MWRFGKEILWMNGIYDTMRSFLKYRLKMNLAIINNVLRALSAFFKLEKGFYWALCLLYEKLQLFQSMKIKLKVESEIWQTHREPTKIPCGGSSLLVFAKRSLCKLIKVWKAPRYGTLFGVSVQTIVAQWVWNASNIVC